MLPPAFSRCFRSAIIRCIVDHRLLLEIVVGENWTCGEKASKKKSGQENSVSLSLCICLCVSVSFSLSLSCGGFLFCRLMEVVQKNEVIGEKVSRFSRLELHDRREIL